MEESYSLLFYTPCSHATRVMLRVLHSSIVYFNWKDNILNQVLEVLVICFRCYDQQII